MMIANLLAALNGAGAKVGLTQAAKGGGTAEPDNAFAQLLAQLTGDGSATKDVTNAGDMLALLKSLLADESLTEEYRDALTELAEQLTVALGEDSSIEISGEDVGVIALLAVVLAESTEDNPQPEGSDGALRFAKASELVEKPIPQQPADAQPMMKQAAALLTELLEALDSTGDKVEAPVASGSGAKPTPERLEALLKALSDFVRKHDSSGNVQPRLSANAANETGKPLFPELREWRSMVDEFEPAAARTVSRRVLELLAARLAASAKEHDGRDGKDVALRLTEALANSGAHKPAEEGLLADVKPLWLRLAQAETAADASRSKPVQGALGSLLQRIAAHGTNQAVLEEAAGGAPRETPFPDLFDRGASTDTRAAASSELWRLADSAGGRSSKSSQPSANNANAGRSVVAGVAFAPERAGPSTPPAALSAPGVGPVTHELNEQVVRNVRYLVNQGGQSLQVRLVPESLGEMRIQVTMGGEAMRVHLASANPLVREALEAQLGQLRESFAREGLDVGRVTVGADMNQGGGAFANHDSRLFQPPGAPGSRQGAGQSGASTPESVPQISSGPAIINGHIDVRI